MRKTGGKLEENWSKIGGKLLENWRKTGGKLEEIWRKSVCKGGWHYCLQENFCQKEQNLWMSSYSQNEEARICQDPAAGYQWAARYSKGGGIQINHFKSKKQ